jgi:hypothetical protein
MILLFGEDIPYSSQVQESYNEYLWIRLKSE